MRDLEHAQEIFDLIEAGMVNGKYARFGGDFSEPGMYSPSGEDDALIYCVGQIWKLVDDDIIPNRDLPVENGDIVKEMEADDWHPRIFQIRRIMKAMVAEGMFITEDEYPIVHDVIVNGIPFENKLREAKENAVYFSVALKNLFERDETFRTVLGGEMCPHTLKYLETRTDAFDLYDTLREQKWTPDFEIVEELAFRTTQLLKMDTQTSADFIATMLAEIYKQNVLLRVV